MLKLTLPANVLYGVRATHCADDSSCVDCAVKAILRNLDIMVEVSETDNRAKKDIAVKLDSVLVSDNPANADIEVKLRNLGDLVISILRGYPDIESKRAIMDIGDILSKMVNVDKSVGQVSLVMTDVIDLLDKRIFADKAGELYKAAITSESIDIYSLGTPVHNAALFVLKQAIATGWPGLDLSDINAILEMWHDCAGSTTYCANWHIHRMSR